MTLSSCNSFITFDFSKYYFVNKKTLRFSQNVFLNWYHQNAWVFDWYHICYVWWECFFNRQSAFLWVLTVLPSHRLLFLYSYEAYFIQGLLKENEKNLARSFNFTFRYIDDVLSLHKCKFGDFVDRIYPIQLEIKDTTDTAGSASFLDLHLDGHKFHQYQQNEQSPLILTEHTKRDHDICRSYF